MSDTTQTEPEGPFAATPREELERQVMDPNVPKMEREWWAADEITRLRAEVERLKEWNREIALNARAFAAENERLRAALREVAEYEIEEGCPCNACQHSAIARAALEGKP